MNVLIGVVLNAMDEARADNRQKVEKIKQLDEIIVEVDKITAYGRITDEEMKQLRQKIAILEKLASPDKPD